MSTLPSHASSNPASRRATDTLSTTAIERAALVRSGDVSPRELVSQALEAIDRLNPQLNAFVAVAAQLEAAAPWVQRRPPSMGMERARPYRNQHGHARVEISLDPGTYKDPYRVRNRARQHLRMLIDKRSTGGT